MPASPPAPNGIGNTRWAAGTSYENGITAHAGGGQTAAYQLSAQLSTIATCATAADSVVLPPIAAWGVTDSRPGGQGMLIFIRNNGAKACQVFGKASDTINGVASGTGVSIPASGGLIGWVESYSSATSIGNWQAVITSDAVGGIPGGSDTQLQYNDAGAFNGIAGVTYAKGTGVLSIAPAAAGTINNMVIGGVTPLAATVTGLTVSQGTITANNLGINLTATWNNAGVTFDAPIFANITNTASAAASVFADWQNSGVSLFTFGPLNVNGGWGLRLGSGSTSQAGMTLGYFGSSGLSAIYGPGVTPSSTSYGIALSNSGGSSMVILNSATQTDFRIANISIMMLQPTYLAPNTNGVPTLGRASVGWKGLYLDFTNTATVGNVTINKPAGRVNLGAGGTTLTLTNSVITDNSHIFLNADGAPGNVVAVQFYAVPANGSCTINAVPAIANQTAIDFLVVNAD